MNTSILSQLNPYLMKNFPFFFFILLTGAVLPASAKNYYVSAAGNNSSIGLSVTTPWQTIAKVNTAFASMSAGDSILFRRGDTFYGALVVGKSGVNGNPIVISAYGTGAKPIITGFTNVSAWTTVSTGIYQAYVPGAKSTLNMVSMNSVPQALGRYPNATAANGGYLSYEAFSGYTAITDNQLTSTTNWTGAEIVIRKKLWVLDRCKVTAHVGTTLTYTNTNSSTYTGTNGFGYFIQNDARTLDQLGEWYFKSSTKYLQFYFGTAAPSSYGVKVSTIDTLLIMSGKSYININSIVFEGANGDALYSASGAYLNILNCDFINEGNGAINIQGTSNVLIENCTTKNILSNAIIINSGNASNVTIRGCSIKNTGNFPGMGPSGGSSYKGIVAKASSNLLIEYNNVDTTGYVGIEFQGSNVNVRYNVVNYFDFVVDDAGGIYTYASGTDAAPGTIYTNRVVSNNIVMNGIGAANGRSTATLYATGIYLDGRAMNTSVLNNTVFNNPRGGIHSNNALNVTISGNTSYNNMNAVSVTRWPGNSVKGLIIKKNILYTKTDAQRSIHYTNAALNEPVVTTMQAALSSLGNIDSNTYSMLNPVSFTAEANATSGGALVLSSPLSLEGWRAFTIHDLNGKKPAKLPVGYKLGVLVGANKFTNSLFNSNISGLTVYGTGVTGAWDNTGKISGGSLKISFTSPAASKYNLIHSPIGAVSAAKKYVLRFSTYGTTQQGIVRAYIRKTASPYNSLIATQTKSFGIGRKDHEFLFNAPTTDAGGSFVIEIEQNSGTTYFDNVEFYEATATMYDTTSQLRFEYNATKVARTVALDSKYTGVDGAVYSGSLTLQPFTSVILVKDTGSTTVPTPVPVTALRASAAATTVNCYGSASTVTVSASAGTAPYTGTGSFSATAGTGSLKLSFLTGMAGSYTLMYYTIGAINSSKNYVLRFTTLGTTTSGNLRVAIRQTATPFATVTAKQAATFGTARKDHEFRFNAPASQTAASFLIEVDQSSGTTYFDNIAFFEADSSGNLIGNNLYTDGQFETTGSKLFTYSSNSNHTATFDYTGKITATHYYTVKDAVNSSSVAAVTITQPLAALGITATAGTINVPGGTTAVVVVATGGTAPYTGTGSFSVLAGTYTYTVTDSRGCTAAATVAVVPFAARPSTTTAAKATGSTPSVAARVISPATSGNVIADKAFLVNAYPNPTTIAFNVMVEGGSNERVTILVYSLDGKLVYQTNGNSNRSYSFGSNFMPGIYVLKAVQNNTVQTQKIIKTGN
ncbi:MAG: right-handed parallel beta-helix repeat-containing protein [Chitinophagaceae bacterium]|nr:right-handed parallel beta-helix repeat-containing protein [Chitinophagaceae bacterium]